MQILISQNLCKYYGSGENMVKALDNVSVSIDDGEFVSIIGTSGSGKSTLLNMLGGLDRPTSGEVYVKNKSKACEEIGIQYEEFLMNENTTMKELLELIQNLNNREKKTIWRILLSYYTLQLDYKNITIILKNK